MRAMILEAIGTPPVLRDVPLPILAEGQVRLRIAACGVCRTYLHIRNGDLTGATLPLVMGRKIVGRIDALWAGSLCA